MNPRPGRVHNEASDAPVIGMTRAWMLPLLLAAVLSAAAAEPDEKRALLPLGERIPDFTLPDGAGRPRQLRDLAEGKLAVLLFTGGSAPGENLSDAAIKLEPLGAVLVMIVTAARRFPALYDGGGAVTRRFTTRPPTAFLIDGDGILRAFTDASSPDAVVSLVDGQASGMYVDLARSDNWTTCPSGELVAKLQREHPAGVAIEQLQAEEYIDDLVKNVVLNLL